MKRIALVGVLVVAAASAWQTPRLTAQVPGAGGAASVTFTKQVLPILQNNCQSCHRPGEVAPFSLLSYQDARPYARAMKNAVSSKQMPPWFADDGFEHYSNDKRLSPADVQTIVAWVDQGAVEGDPKDAPPAVHFEDGWQMKPDLVLEMPKPFHLPASGTIN